MKRYVALLHGDAKSGYGVMFPDFPGCISAGDDFDRAIANATEALAGHVELMRADHDRIPSPRSPDKIRSAGENWVDFDGAIVTMIPLLPPSGKPIRLNISLDESLVKSIDHVADRRGQTRSGFLAEAARQAIGNDRRIGA